MNRLASLPHLAETNNQVYSNKDTAIAFHYLVHDWIDNPTLVSALKNIIKANPYSKLNAFTHDDIICAHYEREVELRIMEIPKILSAADFEKINIKEITRKLYSIIK